MIITIIIIKGFTIERLYQCVEKLNINHSRAREAIYRVLLEEENFLCIQDILTRLEESYPKKVSFNTVYRHLGLFVECGLAIVVHNEFKRAYYTLTSQTQPIVALMCHRCGVVEKLNINPSMVEEKLNHNDFITVHKRCDKCCQN
jgi:Fe2+ or Zn2+ uptake regulation protein